MLPLWDCFTTCDSQARVSFGAAYALDWRVIRDMAQDTGMVTDDSFYRALKLFESKMLDAMKKKQPSQEE
jgi:hypothetical protein